MFCRPDDEVIISQGIRAANQVTDLSLTPIFCFTCREPVGWNVVRNYYHSLVAVNFLLNVLASSNLKLNI